MKFACKKRSILIDDFKTSVSLEDDFWYGLLEIAAYEKITVPQLIKRVHQTRKSDNLSSAIRLFVFNYRGKKRSVRWKRRKRL